VSSSQGKSATTGASNSEFSTGSLAFAIVIWLVAAAFLALSFGFTERARVLPQFVGVPAVVIASMLVVREVRAVVLHQRISVGARPAGEDAHEGQTRRSETQALLWLGALVAVVYLFGMLAGFAVFLMVFLRFFGRERWLLASTVTVAIIAIIYFGFAQFFALRLYPGLLPPLVGL
jgi:hypothetical protein